MPGPMVRLHPINAKERGLSDGIWYVHLLLTGKESSKLEITNILKPGMIDMFHGWEKANVNLLIARDFCKISGFPPFKEGLCQIEKA